MTKRKVECPPKKLTSIATGEKVRFGSLLEIDARTNVGSEAWKARHEEHRLKKLSAWRGLHAVASHGEIRSLARSMGVGCSSSLQVTSMVAAVRRAGKTGKVKK